MQVAEIFYSLQGEGKLTGLPCAFLRLAGCNLHCRYCDSRYAHNSQDAQALALDNVVEQLLAYPARHVVITGGEPLLADELGELCKQLRTAGRHVTLETSATVDNVVEVDLASISPKLSNSVPNEAGLAQQHESKRLNIPVIQAYLDQAQRMGAQYQLKFVLDKPSDIEEVKIMLAQFEKPCPGENVLLMPQALNRRQLARRSAWVAELCKEHGYRFCTRLHILLYGNQRGK